MRFPQLSPLVWSRLGAALGALVFVVGVGLAVGLAVAFMTSGAALVAYCLLLIDVDGKGGGRR